MKPHVRIKRDSGLGRLALQRRSPGATLPEVAAERQARWADKAALRYWQVRTRAWRWRTNGMVVDKRAAVESILSELDDLAEDPLAFPWFDNGFIAPATARLTAFADKTRWALIFELVGYNHKMSGPEQFETAVYSVGGFLDAPGASDVAPANVMERRYFVDDLPVDDDDALQNGRPLRARLRKMPVRVSTSQQEYVRLGLIAEAAVPHPAAILRWVAARYRMFLLLTAAEMSALVPKGMPLVLQHDEWRHPRSSHEVPSSLETFRSIAKVLATRDPSKYVVREKPNSGWQNWPMAGTL